MAGKYSWDDVDMNDMVYNNNEPFLGTTSEVFGDTTFGDDTPAGTSIFGGMPGNLVNSSTGYGSYHTSDYVNEADVRVHSFNEHPHISFAVYVDNEEPENCPFKIKVDGVYKSIFGLGTNSRLGVKCFNWTTNTSPSPSHCPSSQNSGWQLFPTWCNAIKILMMTPPGLNGTNSAIWDGFLHTNGTYVKDQHYDYNFNQNRNNDNASDKDNVNINRHININYDLTKTGTTYEKDYDYCNNVFVGSSGTDGRTFEYGGGGGDGNKLFNVQYIGIDPSWQFKFTWVYGSVRGKLKFDIRNPNSNNALMFEAYIYSGDKGTNGVTKYSHWEVPGVQNFNHNGDLHSDGRYNNPIDGFNTDDDGTHEMHWGTWDLGNKDNVATSGTASSFSGSYPNSVPSSTYINPQFKKVSYTNSSEYKIDGSVFFFKMD